MGSLENEQVEHETTRKDSVDIPTSSLEIGKDVNGTSKKEAIDIPVGSPEIKKVVNGTTKTEAVNISVALSPCNTESVPGLVKDISSLEKALSNNEPGARIELLEKARSLVRAVETPRETMIKHCWAQVSQLIYTTPRKWQMHENTAKQLLADCIYCSFIRN